MKKIESIAGTAAALLVDNISTDIISPSILLQQVNTDLARGLFGPWRYDEAGEENPSFVLNQPRCRGARILLAGANFGSGSSREHAVWCLLRYGIECVIAPSFADIFYENAFKNGLVALRLPAETLATLAERLAAAPRPLLAIDLRTQSINLPDGDALRFELEASRREALLEGLDELDLILREEPAIAAFEARAQSERPWLYPSAETMAACLQELR